MTYSDILNFWFEEIDSKKHWVKDPDFDQEIQQRFGEIHNQAAQCALFSWREKPEGRLAEIIILDQFSRNMFRDTSKAFAYDPLALALAQEAVHSGDDKKIKPEWRSFLYMPYMHSESKVVHEESLKLFSQEGLSPDYEIKHKVIIDQFGRYPHRNKILGRESTQEELDFLNGPNSSF